MTIKFKVPEGETLIGVTRSCQTNEVLRPIPPSEVGKAEGYVYDDEAGTVTLYAKSFCVFGFMMHKDESDVCEGPVDCPWAYQFKVFVRTTEAVTGVDNLSCGRICLRQPAIRRFAGFIYGSSDESGCGCCGCNAWRSATLLLWDYDTKKPAGFTKLTGLQLDRIISSNLDTSIVEVAFDLDALAFAGYGRAAKREGSWTIRSASGFCAGLLPQACTVCSNDCGCDGDGDLSAAVRVWSLCDSENSAPKKAAKWTAAYGKWTLDWSPSVYYRLKAGQSLLPGSSWKNPTKISFGLE